MGHRQKTAYHPAAQTAGPASPLRKNRAVLRFGLIFGLLTSLYYVVALTPWVDAQLFPAYLRINAQASSAVLNCLGQSSRVENTTIRSPRFAMTIKRGCDALEPSWLLCAGVIAFPTSWRRRALGIGSGVACILALNLVRIVSLYYFGIFTPTFFETMHVEIWPVLFIFAALGIWLVWVRWVQQPSAPAKHVAP